MCLSTHIYMSGMIYSQRGAEGSTEACSAEVLSPHTPAPGTSHHNHSTTSSLQLSSTSHKLPLTGLTPAPSSTPGYFSFKSPGPPPAPHICTSVSTTSPPYTCYVHLFLFSLSSTTTRIQSVSFCIAYHQSVYMMNVHGCMYMYMYIQSAIFQDFFSY